MPAAIIGFPVGFVGAKESKDALFETDNLPCGRLDQIPQIQINKIIENEIKLFKPKTVFTHSLADSNKDHHKVLDYYWIYSLGVHLMAY